MYTYLHLYMWAILQRDKREDGRSTWAKYITYMYESIIMKPIILYTDLKSNFQNLLLSSLGPILIGKMTSQARVPISKLPLWQLWSFPYALQTRLHIGLLLKKKIYFTDTFCRSDRVKQTDSYSFLLKTVTSWRSSNRKYLRLKV